jgi:eukaryotic-like serine/threonine-protein kinase
MGAVYLALASGSADFEKLVVLKELRLDLAKNDKVVSLFMQEARLAGRLNHANIVQTLEAGQVDGRYFLAMEYLDGQPLSKLIAKDDGLAVPLLLRLQVISDVLSGLHYAHELRDFDQTPLPIVHCDVSPSNVFITYDGSVKVIDFGVAKAAGQASDIRGFQGKVRYASPEQLNGKVVDRRADVFSTGILLWEAITQRSFVELGMTDEEVILRRLSGAETRLASAAPGVDAALAAICERALRLNPEERYSTAEEFRVALVQYCSSRAPRMDPGDIANLLRSKFAASRSKAHALVRRQLATATEATAIPQLIDPDTKNDDVTTVADLSTFVRASRDINPKVISNAEVEPKKRQPWVIPALIAVAIAALIGAFALTNSPGAPEAVTAGDTSAKGVLDVDAVDVPKNDTKSLAPSSQSGSEQIQDETKPSGQGDPRSPSEPPAVSPSRSTSKVATPPPSNSTEKKRTADAPAATVTPPATSPSVFDQELKDTERKERRALDSNPFDE